MCEDEKTYQTSIYEKITQWIDQTGHEGVKISIFTSSEDFLEKWEDGLKADILFLDIIFQDEVNGMEIAKQVRLTDDFIPIVFVTNSEAYVKEGYSVRAFRYLNKPVSFEALAMCLDIAYKQYTLSHNEYFIVSEIGRRLALRHEDILYIEAQSPYALIHMQGKKPLIKIRYRFADLQMKLSEELFILCHRSYLVNIIHVRAVRRSELMLSTGQVLPVSRSYTEHLNIAFDNYYQGGGLPLGLDDI